jgi:hypothetical protein
MAKVALRKIVKTLDRTPAVRGIADRENNVSAAGLIDWMRPCESIVRTASRAVLRMPYGGLHFQ